LGVRYVFGHYIFPKKRKASGWKSYGSGISNRKTVVNFMLEQIGYTAKELNGNIKTGQLDKLSIVDPACGSGTFLYSATDEVINSFKPTTDETSKQIEDIIAGLCGGLARNFLANVAKGKNIQPPIVFLGGVSENVGMRKAFEKALNQKIIVPEYNTVMGAFGVALLVKELALKKTKFFGFEISDQDIRCTSFVCKGCPNNCEVIEARIEGKVISRWGDRCGKWSSLNL